MKYVSFVNETINNKVSQAEKFVLYGQNVSAGSCLSGLTRGLKVGDSSFILNTPNSENTLVGIGFGLMLSGISSAYFMKQQDFLLLGIDHLVNTYNFIRLNEPKASFTVVTIAVDSGYQGLQSSLNNFGDFCSMARIPGYTITNRHDAQRVINAHLISPGFRIIGVSQRLFGTEILECEQIIYCEKDCTLFQYYQGKDATIVCFNFSFPQGSELYDKLKARGYYASLFNVNSVTPTKWDRIIEDVRHTKNIIVIDDSKSENLSCYDLLTNLLSECQVDNRLVIKREFQDSSWLWPNKDELIIDYEGVIERIAKRFD